MSILRIHSRKVSKLLRLSERAPRRELTFLLYLSLFLFLPSPRPCLPLALVLVFLDSTRFGPPPSSTPLAARPPPHTRGLGHFRLTPARAHKMSLQRGINLRALAEKMGNCSGAEVRGICTEAGEYHHLHLLHPGKKGGGEETPREGERRSC